MKESSAKTEPRVYEGAAALVRLAELLLAPEPLIAAAEGREIQRRSYSHLMPSSYVGFGAAGAAFVQFAEPLFAQGGWTKSEWRGVPRMVNTTIGIAIASCPGDEMTGLRGPRQPRSRYPRGVHSDVFVKTNATQSELPGVFIGRGPTLPAEANTVTYWLLDYCDGEDILRAELSLPINEDEAGRFCAWEERIILDVPSFDPLAGRRRDDDEPLQIAVNIRPRK